MTAADLRRPPDRPEVRGGETKKRVVPNLKLTIPGEVLIWTVDRNFDLLTFNEAFAQYMSEKYGFTLSVGRPAFDGAEGTTIDRLRQSWDTHYRRALSGETVTLEEYQWGETYRYSVSPIIKAEEIVGAMVLGQRVAEEEKPGSEIDINDAGLRLQALQSILNPHFIFNALSSIQFFISHNDKVNAIQYLSILSGFIRAILAHSIAETVSLGEEAMMLKHYIDLEMIRFEDKFDFSLEISPGINLDAVRIPPLLIQPFVENAILYGLYNMKGKWKLSIKVREESDSIIFEIRDNGICREKSLEVKSNVLDRRASPSEWSTLIQLPSSASLTIVDTKEPGSACDTKVIVSVPRHVRS